MSSTPIRPTFYRPEGELTDRLLLNMLSLVGENDQAPADVREWSEFERLIVADWAIREHLRASDNQVRSRPRPAGLLGVR
jgi:hypothetical protein